MGISREELFAALGVIKIVDPIVEDAYALQEQKIWLDDLDSDPHGAPWHTSFHASSFPGGDEKHCGREAIYSLLNIPSQKPIAPYGRAIMDVGKAVEEEIVWRLYHAGVLLSAKPDDETQTGFEIPAIWLSGNLDAIITRRDNGAPHVVEIKGKDPDVVRDMQRGGRSYDPGHKSQLLAYVAMVRSVSEELWPDRPICNSGSIYYFNRSRPRETHEFLFEHDQDFIQKGIDRLSEWKENFINGELPPRDKSWRWTESPCDWCDYKKLCKDDVRNDVGRLEDSCAVKFAKTVNSAYDHEKVIKAVQNRWKGKE